MRKSGFLRHHRKIRIEGTDLPGIVNKCIRNGILLKDLRYKDQLESTVEVKDDDYRRLKKIAGH
ncbi:MAG: sporulation protein YqfD, partial [Firmicutes bacterium]|nr:sporulation protein YqfD [Bacillota bacterium]